MDLSLDVRTQSDGVTVIEATGEVDVYTAPQLRSALLDAAEAEHPKIIVDLTGVDFLDSTGLGVLVGGLKRARTHGGAMALACSAERILKIFRITGLTKVFPIGEDVAAAGALFEGGPPAPPDPDTVGWHWFQARIYLSTNAASAEVETALRGVADAFGFEIVLAEDPVTGSWFREFFVRLRDSGRLPTKEEQFVKLLRAGELHLLHKPQSEIDSTQAAAVANLITALGDTPRAVLQVGSVLLVKVDETVLSRNLTQLELAHWERNPALFQDPSAAMRELQRAHEPAHPWPAISS